MEYEVRLEIFEGPLDLLLHLIRKNEVDILRHSHRDDYGSVSLVPGSDEGVEHLSGRGLSGLGFHLGSHQIQDAPPRRPGRGCGRSSAGNHPAPARISQTKEAAEDLTEESWKTCSLASSPRN